MFGRSPTHRDPLRAFSQVKGSLLDSAPPPVIYEGPEHPDFIAFGTETVHFGIQAASVENDPPSVLTWQIGVTDIDSAIERCRSAGISYELEQNDPAPGWTYRRLLIRTPSGYRLALEGPSE
jgi:predicted enzyme related to lactoylglutathione lyase